MAAPFIQLPVALALIKIAAAPKLTCAWCPDFDPRKSQGQSHGICKACQEKMMGCPTPCNDPGCRTHGVAASNARQNEFLRDYDKEKQ